MSSDTSRREDAFLDEYDAEAEAFAEAIDREDYLNGSGQKEDLVLGRIYERHARLFTRETIARFDAADGNDERFAELRRFAITGYLDAAASDATEAISARETADSVEWDGATVTYRSVAPIVRNEPDAARRHDLEQRLVAATSAQNPLREQRWDVLYAKARELGYATYRAMIEDVGRLDIASLTRLMQSFLAGTERAYKDQLTVRLRGIGIDPALAEKSDLGRLVRATEFDAYFRADRIVDIYQRSMAALGFSDETQRRIILDVENRPTKSPRAFCSAPRIPHEVYLVISPQGGQEDYGAMFHEGGHSQHMAHADASLPFALRGMGDNSVTEGFAFVLERIISSPRWLADELGMHDPSAYLAMQRFNRLYMLRRYAAKLLYESGMHAGDNVRGSQKHYADLLTSATGVRYAPEDYLFDVDDGYYCARYLRAWIFDAQLRAMLAARFGPDWHRSPQAGAKLASLWSHGQRYDAPTLLHREGAQGLDIAPLVAELTTA